MRSYIDILGNRYRAKITLRSHIAYEEIMGEPFDPKKLINNIVLLYCAIISNNDDYPEWSEFLRMMDEDDNAVAAMEKWMTGSDELGGLGESDSGTTEKKKRGRKPRTSTPT